MPLCCSIATFMRFTSALRYIHALHTCTSYFAVHSRFISAPRSCTFTASLHRRLYWRRNFCCDSETPNHADRAAAGCTATHILSRHRRFAFLVAVLREHSHKHLIADIGAAVPLIFAILIARVSHTSDARHGPDGRLPCPQQAPSGGTASTYSAPQHCKSNTGVSARLSHLFIAAFRIGTGATSLRITLHNCESPKYERLFPKLAMRWPTVHSLFSAFRFSLLFCIASLPASCSLS